MPNRTMSFARMVDERIAETFLRPVAAEPGPPLTQRTLDILHSALAREGNETSALTRSPSVVAMRWFEDASLAGVSQLVEWRGRGCVAVPGWYALSRRTDVVPLGFEEEVWFEEEV